MPLTLHYICIYTHFLVIYAIALHIYIQLIYLIIVFSLVLICNKQKSLVTNPPCPHVSQDPTNSLLQSQYAHMPDSFSAFFFFGSWHLLQWENPGFMTRTRLCEYSSNIYVTSKTRRYVGVSFALSESLHTLRFCPFVLPLLSHLVGSNHLLHLHYIFCISF